MMKKFTIKNLSVKRIACLLGMMLATAQADAQYCAATNTSSSSYYITNVSTTGGSANISNMGTNFTSGGYADYTSQYVTVLPGGTFTLTSSCGPSSSYTYMWNVFCDWNYDGDFSDPGENVYTMSSYVNSITTNITVPASTSLGNVRMRIRSAYISPAPPACGDARTRV